MIENMNDNKILIYDKFTAEISDIVTKYGITEEHAGCYLCNYYDEYICSTFNNGCDYINKCNEIRKSQNV